MPGITSNDWTNSALLNSIERSFTSCPSRSEMKQQKLVPLPDIPNETAPSSMHLRPSGFGAMTSVWRIGRFPVAGHRGMCRRKKGPAHHAPRTFASMAWRRWGGGYLPLNLGCLFSRNEVMPSLKSSVWKQMRWARVSKSSCPSRSPVAPL
jgi:hypothetical protein